MSPAPTLRSVVLPAPFGPMRPCTSPSRTAKLTPSSAWTPPKERSTFSTESNIPAGAEVANPGGERREPVRDEEDHREEDGAVQEEAQRSRSEPQRLPRSPKQLREDGEECRTDHGPVEGGRSADDRVDEHVHGAREAVAVRRHHEGEVRLERAGEARQRGAEREHRDLVTGGGDSHGASGGLVLADRLESVARARPAQAAEDVESEGEGEIDGPKAGLLREGERRGGAVRVAPVRAPEPHHLAESDGSDGEKDAPQAQRRQAERHREEGG